MSNEKQENVFEVEKIKQLIELMKENEVTEIDIRQGESRIQLRREKAIEVATPVAAPASIVPAAVPAPVAVEAPAAPKDEAFMKTINSPMVGTFYASSNPDSPAFVKIGDAVDAEKTVCIIEAMKVFNEIQAEMSGKVVAILVQNGESVDFGKPLFKIDTRG
ncbi:MAG: acetyl-CoA carboxylase biotin carboxyl carrier protein [Thermoguttaceae bacterium]|nr:acetyl-CoA carboxylase biotin carboxyl carrier protein [Thermoguttaceae bacterium]